MNGNRIHMRVVSRKKTKQNYFVRFFAEVGTTYYWVRVCNGDIINVRIRENANEENEREYPSTTSCLPGEFVTFIECNK